MPEITTNHVILGVIAAVVWYFAIVVLIRTIRRETVNVWISSAILFVLVYTAFFVCPWIRHSEFFGG